jgi:hypothetical protein
MDDDMDYPTYAPPNSSNQTAQVLRCIAQSLLAAANEMETPRHKPIEQTPPHRDEYDL